MCQDHAMLYVPAFGRPVDIPAGADVASTLGADDARRPRSDRSGADRDVGTKAGAAPVESGNRSPFGSAA